MSWTVQLNAGGESVEVFETGTTTDILTFPLNSLKATQRTNNIILDRVDEAGDLIFDVAFGDIDAPAGATAALKLAAIQAIINVDITGGGVLPAGAATEAKQDSLIAEVGSMDVVTGFIIASLSAPGNSASQILQVGSNIYTSGSFQFDITNIDDGVNVKLQETNDATQTDWGDIAGTERFFNQNGSYIVPFNSNALYIRAVFVDEIGGTAAVIGLSVTMNTKSNFGDGVGTGILQSVKSRKLEETSALLGNAGVFTSRIHKISEFASVAVSIYTDQIGADDGLTVEFGPDGVNWYVVEKDIVFPSNARSYEYSTAGWEYCRVTETNGATPQTAHSLEITGNVRRTQDSMVTAGHISFTQMTAVSGTFELTDGAGVSASYPQDGYYVLLNALSGYIYILEKTTGRAVGSNLWSNITTPLGASPPLTRDAINEVLLDVEPTQTTHAQLTAPGSTSSVNIGSSAKIIYYYTVANIDTNVVVRVQGGYLATTNNISGDITITANGEYYYVVNDSPLNTNFEFVSELGGTNATIDVVTSLIPNK